MLWDNATKRVVLDVPETEMSEPANKEIKQYQLQNAAKIRY